MLGSKPFLILLIILKVFLAELCDVLSFVFTIVVANGAVGCPYFYYTLKLRSDVLLLPNCIAIMRGHFDQRINQIGIVVVEVSIFKKLVLL